MILGKRIRLRGIEREDLTKFVSWLNDPEVIKGLTIITPLSVAQEESWYESMRKNPSEEQPLGIEIQTDAGWKLIGNISFLKINWISRETEIGIFIGEKEYWNHGYGREAMILMIRHGFMALGLNRIFLRVFSTNPRAIRSYEKAGFHHEGRLRQAHFQNGEFVDVLIMSILRSEWQDDPAV